MMPGTSRPVRSRPRRARSELARLATSLGIAAALLPHTAHPARAEPAETTHDVTDLTLEDLMQVEITSVSKREQLLADAAAAVYVITSEDIRQSGATSIPELLRLAPGVSVARIDANKWAISVRGFDSRFANKILVLIDGRSVYSPLFAGVYWDVQDTLLEDIERIEIIRGPGASLWGANAVNGVINIITRSAQATRDGFASVLGGKEERAAASVRYGFALGPSADARLYAKAFDRDGAALAGGGDAGDGWRAVRGGFRADGESGAASSYRLQGDLYHEHAGQRIAGVALLPPYRVESRDTVETTGGDLLGRWTYRPSARTEASWQLYYDRTDRDERIEHEVRDTWDADYQQRYTPGPHHELLWGLSYRYTTDRIRGGDGAVVEPDRRGLHVASAFLEDVIHACAGRVQVTLGSKLEHNDFTGLELQPTGRVLFRLDDRQSVWAAVSRAVRTPARALSDARIDFNVVPTESGLPVLAQLRGNPDLESEVLVAYEGGYRAWLHEHLSLDLAIFRNHYRDLLTAEPGTPEPVLAPPVPHLLLPQVFGNGARGDSRGLELAAKWRPAVRLELEGAYTWFLLDISLEPDSHDLGARRAEGDTPRHQGNLSLALELPRRVEIGATAYYVGERPNQATDSMLRLDARLGIHPTSRVDLSLVLQNLLDARHREFGESGIGEVPSEVERSAYLRLAVRF